MHALRIFPLHATWQRNYPMTKMILVHSKQVRAKVAGAIWGIKHVLVAARVVVEGMPSVRYTFLLAFFLCSLGTGALYFM